MPFLSIPFIEEVRKTYKGLVIEGPASGDGLFEQFGIGNKLTSPDFPYERFCDYEELLKMLYREDPEKYRSLHKGTPFYYMSWLAFDFRDFEKALFYIDAAISEDIRAHQHTQTPNEWMQAPGSAILTFGNTDQQVAQRTIISVKEYLLEQLNRFKGISGQNWTIEDFVHHFVHCLLRDNTKRTIVTAFYVFLLEFQDRLTQLQLRSSIGGSIAPCIGHLFRGALIFESLLKDCYPEITKSIKKNPPKIKPEKLGDIFHSPEFSADFFRVDKTSSNSLQDIVAGITDETAETAFRTAGKLRNTTAHNLIWDDVFSVSDNYRKLFHQVVNAIFYLITKKF